MLRAKSQRYLATQAIRQLIFSGQLSSGIRTSERSLTTTFLRSSGLGRTPVREALAVLTFQGLIEQYPQSGFAVRRIDAREATQVLRLQQITQTLIVAELSRAQSDLTIPSRLASAMQTAAVANQSVRFLDHARAFHLALAELGDYAIAVDAIAGFRDRFGLFIANTSPLSRTERANLVSNYRQLLISIQEDPSGDLSCRHLNQLLDLERSFVTARAALSPIPA